MSTSLLYHAFGLQGYDYVRQFFHAGRITLRVRPKPKLIRCPACRKQDVLLRGKSLRLLRTTPIGRKPVLLEVEVPRVQCRCCGVIGRIELKIAAPRRKHTHAFERYVLDLVKVATIQDVARLLGVGWDTVKCVFKRHLARRFANPPLSRLTYIAIDEISVRKCQKYLTLVMDLVSGAVVFVGDGKGADSLLPFWRRLKRSKARIKAVAMDMSAAYIAAVLEHLPKTPIVFDHFHVVKLMNDGLTEIRRKLYRELTGPLEKKALKGSRWILLKNPENLNQEKDEEARLQEALKMNEPLAVAYYLKEDLRQIWSQPDKDTAERVLDDWIARARASGVGPLARIAATLAGYRFGILAWYDHRITSGPMEGTNNKIKTLKRQAYGFRDQEFFKLRIMGLHEAKYALTG